MYTSASRLLITPLIVVVFFFAQNTQCSQTSNRPQQTSTENQHSSRSSNRKPLTSRNLVLVSNNQQAATTSAPASTTPASEAPDFSEPIGNHSVALGRDAQLACKIRNLNNYRTAWLRVEDKGILTIHTNIITRNYRIGLINNDNQAQERGTEQSFVLTIKNVQPSDRGGYMCQINSVPMKYAVGHLDVLTPPVFEEQPAATGGASDAVTIPEGGNATLSCRAGGHPQPVISWRREDNEPIVLNGAQLDGTGTGSGKTEGPTLALSSVSRLSAGAYLCIASNGVQPSASKRQVLDVQFGPVIRLPRKEIGARVGQPEVRLTCYVELNPMGSYHWVKLPPGSSSSSGGSEEAANQPEAAALSQADDAALIEHEELGNSDKFEIVIKQQPAPEQQQPGEQQQQQSGGQVIQMTLLIRQIERQDFGWFKCLARNSLGIQSNSIKLHEVTGSSSQQPTTSSSSSFSLNNMFRGSISSEEQELSRQQQQNDQQVEPPSATSGRHQPSGGGSSGRPSLSRTHTRSSWAQRGAGSSRASDQTATNALLGDSSSAATSTKLFLSSSNYLLLTLILTTATTIAQLIAIASKNQYHRNHQPPVER